MLAVAAGGPQHRCRARPDRRTTGVAWATAIVAIPGLLLGVGLLRGTWYGARHVAHLHVNTLGWGRRPDIAGHAPVPRTNDAVNRIEPGADTRCRGAATRRHRLTVAMLLLLAGGVGGPAGTAARVLAAIALGVFAWAITVVCMPVL